MICVVLDKEVEEQRQRLPHTIADTFLGQVEHQSRHLLEEFYTHYPILPTSFTTTSGLLLTIMSVRVRYV